MKSIKFGIERKAPVILALNTMSEYSDNIFLRDKNVSRDIITYIEPRVRINIQEPRYLIMLDYRLKVVRYANLDPAPGLDLRDMNYTGHVMDLVMDRLLSKRCKIGLDDRYLSSRRPRDMYLGTNRISKAKFYRNWLSPYVEYYLSEKNIIRVNFLHDGRAKTIQEAILWHGGEAELSKNNFINLSPKKQKTLIDFLERL